MVMKSRPLQTMTVTAGVTIAEGQAVTKAGILATGIADFYGFALFNAVSGDKLAVGTSGEFTAIVGAVAVTDGQKLKTVAGLMVDATAGTENCIATSGGDVGDKITVLILNANRF
jgi:hypothetical protein